MQKRKSVAIEFVFFVVMVACLLLARTFTGIRHDRATAETTPIPDYTQIRERGTVRIVTHIDNTDHFVYRGAPIGFQLDVSGAFADKYDLKPEYFPTIEKEDPIDALLDGRVDIIASSCIYNPSYSLDSIEIIPMAEVKQVLVGRKDQYGTLSERKIYIDVNSSVAEILFEMNPTVDITEIYDFSPLDWVDALKNGDIDYLVCSENDAAVITYMTSGLSVLPNFEYTGDYKAWLVRSNSPELKSKIEAWLETFKKTNVYASLYDRYFTSDKVYARISNRYYASLSGHITPYDDIIKKICAKEDNIDWKLVAAMMHYESNFDGNALSSAGAFGVMQLMPATMERYGITEDSSIEDQIQAAVSYLKDLDRIFSETVTNKEERVKFVCAAYNTGPGHILDAQRIANSMGRDTGVWNGNVDLSLLAKTDPKILSNKDLVRYGRCRAGETVRYVNDLMSCMDAYSLIVD